MHTPAPWLRCVLLGASLLLAAPGLGAAQTFSSGSTGTDGPFTPGCTPTPCTVTMALPPSGVFNFTTINVPANVTVVFTRNAANTPVTLLATGNVALTGTLSVSGADASAYGRPGQGGPGGFDGGAGADGVITSVGGNGLGPGGGGGGGATYGGGGGGGFGTAGTNGSNSGAGVGGPAYGSSALRPIVGGSGGGGGGANVGNQTGGGGGGGGGAIVIASSTGITLNFALDSYSRVIPQIRANGGAGAGGSGGGGGGSGGAIRVIAPTITGGGQLQATAGYGSGGGNGGTGRVRLEASNLSFTGSTAPLAVTGYPAAVFPATGQPSLTIASVGGIPAPASPSGNILATPDILLPSGTTSPVEVVLTASNIPLGTTIQVTATPQSGAKSTATSSGLTGTVASSTATASLTLSLTQTSVLTASATFPLVASLGSGPLYAEGPVPSLVEGEEVTHIRVAAVFGGASTVTYITHSGREVAVP